MKNTLLPCLLLTSLNIISSSAIREIRGYVSDIITTQKKLAALGATYKGYYQATDYVYDSATHAFDFNLEFVRVRVYQFTQWQTKQCVAIHKQRNQYGFSAKTVWYQEFDTFEQAQEFLKNNFILQFSYNRKGWEYDLNSMRIFVEDIQGIKPSIEVIGQDEKMIGDLFKNLEVHEIISDSIPRLLRRISYENKH